MSRGIIRKFRGRFGFIAPVGGADPEVIVYVDDLPASLRRHCNGTEVEYEWVRAAEGPRAKNVRAVR